MLEIIILISTILISHNNISAQTYDTITKQRETTKNNPQIQVGRALLPSSTYLAVDPSINKIYVANSRSNTVSVIDSDSGNVTNIPVGGSPGYLAVSPLTDKIYVANSFSGTVSVINPSSDKVISTIPVGTYPSFIGIFSRLLAEKEKIYVANSASNTVSVINSSSDKVISTILVGKLPGPIVVDPTKNKIYVANLFSNTVSVINPYSDKMISTIPVGPGPNAIAASNAYPSIS
jgi:YVTN family beta-propeller protein